MARVVVDVMLKPEILDPQGQAVANALPRLGVDEVASVRIGRRIELQFDGDPDLEKINELASRLLANPVIEDYTVTVDGEPAGPAPSTHAAPAELAAEPAVEAPAADPAPAEAEGGTPAGEAAASRTAPAEPAEPAPTADEETP